MTDQLYSKQADSTTYDKLFGSMPGEEIQVKSVKIASGQGKLSRGTVLGIVTATKKAVIVNSANTDGSQSADCILTDDIDATSADVTITAYSSGTFNRDALIFGGTDTADTHETRLREFGIFLNQVIPY
ncbi:head decoration protein [Ferviditalea candida]|uniref:Head decoration protein n=1 Tax=Ferviditalea candida TaxID=3108399 RepID=A0ABU5ZKM8_9BACL|nr:head decoration protein [Paenibacillaceae bacterium T2]